MAEALVEPTRELDGILWEADPAPSSPVMITTSLHRQSSACPASDYEGLDCKFIPAAPG